MQVVHAGKLVSAVRQIESGTPLALHSHRKTQKHMRQLLFNWENCDVVLGTNIFGYRVNRRCFRLWWHRGQRCRNREDFVLRLHCAVPAESARWRSTATTLTVGPIVAPSFFPYGHLDCWITVGGTAADANRPMWMITVRFVIERPPGCSKANRHRSPISAIVAPIYCLARPLLFISSSNVHNIYGTRLRLTVKRIMLNNF